MNVEEVTRSRANALSASSPARVEDDYMDTEVGTRGLIRVRDQRGEVVALEFVEPEEVWADPDALEEYGETAADGIRVTIIVPDQEKNDAEEYLAEMIGKGVEVLSYSEAATVRPG